MAEQEIKILLITQSEIISEGLSNILKESFPHEIIVVRDLNEVTDIPEFSGNILVILHSEYYENNRNTFSHVFPDDVNIRYLKISDNKSTADNDNNISLFEKASLIVIKTEQVIRQFKHPREENVGQELSKREKEVLLLVAKGLSNKEIADKLFLSIHTVISHRKNLSEKIGIKTAPGMAMYAVLKKIIDISDIDTSELM